MAMSASSSSQGLTREEALALVIALVAHVGLIAALTLAPPGKTIMSPPERMTVTFADEIADQSTSPQPDAETAPDVAPVLGEAAPEPVPPQPAPQIAPPQPRPAPPPPPPRAQPAPQPKPVPAPQPRVAAAPPPKPVAKPAPPKPAAAAAAAAPADQRLRRRPDAPAGASRIGNDFLSGIAGSSKPGTATNPPAAAFGPEVAASLVSGIARQIKPHWTAPQGVDADKLVTVLAWSLNADGSLAGRPQVVQQLGITDTNRAQAQRHAEQAIRAVQLAAPFNLPAPYYAKWKRIASFRFDRKLSQ
jgi:outer membrane biosynthesis protein TonB